MLETIKMLLCVEDTSKDAIINFHIQSITQKILNYCNITELPIELETIVIEKVVSSISDKKDVKSESMGSVSKTYADKQTNILDDVTPQLNRFRKVRFI